ncbi:hypothetical protein MKW94_025288 [Papaver nudicaule]|uniref:Citrate transporter-like domain-containing protein n=1 Tax=Papaver nudicaule TaxID=74823 RepID=A0AA41SLT0_PAPNU|nr:hypothetical protein [Papaver nudicaule]
MALASTAKVALGSIAFGIFWMLAVFPALPVLPIGRTAGSLLGAMLMVMFRVLSPGQAYSAVNLPILGLLFGTMVVSTYLERADMFKYLGKLLSWKSLGPKDLLCRVCFISAISSALFTNDTCCVVLTVFVLKIAKQHNLPPRPFLLALASSANIGSSATPIGNPQNLVIALQSKISFQEFVSGILPAMIVGVVVNTFILLCMFCRVLSVQKDEEDVVSAQEVEVAEADVSSHRFSPATMSFSQEWKSTLDGEVINNKSSRSNSLGELHHMEFGNITVSGLETVSHHVRSESTNMHSESKENGTTSNPFPQLENTTSSRGREGTINGMSNSNLDIIKKWKGLMWKTSVYLITIGMLVALLLGLNMSWTVISASLALMVLDFKDAGPSLEKVSYSLLVFFCGMFITIDGFNKTGIPSAIWDLMEPHARINHPSGIIVLAVVILGLSNLASNVPTVLLLGARVAASAAVSSASDEKKAWLILAWVSTVAGNLSLLGSAANLIVCEQARRAPVLGYNLSFRKHLHFGFPSTLIVTAIGLLLIRG